MEVQRIGSIPPDSNPFNYDAYRMGTRLGTNVIVMHSNHGNEVCDYLIIVYTITG